MTRRIRFGGVCSLGGLVAGVVRPQSKERMTVAYYMFRLAPVANAKQIQRGAKYKSDTMFPSYDASADISLAVRSCAGNIVSEGGDGLALSDLLHLQISRSTFGQRP